MYAGPGALSGQPCTLLGLAETSFSSKYRVALSLARYSGLSSSALTQQVTRSRSAPSFSYPAPAPSPLSPATPVIQSLKSSKISQRGSCRKVRCKACSSIRSHCQVQGLLLLSGICWLFFCVCLFFKEKENKPKTQQQQTNSSYSSCPPPFKSRSNT